MGVVVAAVVQAHLIRQYLVQHARVVGENLAALEVRRRVLVDRLATTGLGRSSGSSLGCRRGLGCGRSLGGRRRLWCCLGLCCFRGSCSDWLRRGCCRRYCRCRLSLLCGFWRRCCRSRRLAFRSRASALYLDISGVCAWRVELLTVRVLFLLSLLRPRFEISGADSVCALRP